MLLILIHTGVACWCPAEFTSSHVRYTDTICSNNRSVRYEVNMEIPTGPTEGTPQRMTKDLLSENEKLLRYLAGELLLVCALYSLIKCIMCCSSFDVLFSYNLHRSYSKTPAYIIVQMAGCFIWLLFAYLTYSTYNPDVLSVSKEPFICDFEIRRLGSAYRYSLQCVDSGESAMKLAVMINMGICVVVGFSKLVHIVAVFGIQPLLKVDKVAMKMVEKKVIKENSEINLGFGLSDLYFAMLVSGRDVTPQLYLKATKDEGRDKVPYGSRPPSMIC